MSAAVSNVEIPESEYGLHRLPHLADSILQVLLPDEVRRMREEPCWQMETGRSAKTLVKYPDLRIVLVTMRARTRIRQHQTNARLAVIALSGHLRVHLAQTSMDLSAGELLALDQNVPHDVEAIRQSTFLLIVSWPGSAPNQSLRREHEDRPVDEHDDVRELREKMLDKTIADSFPASDPPSTDPAPLADLFVP